MMNTTITTTHKEYLLGQKKKSFTSSHHGLLFLVLSDSLKMQLNGRRVKFKVKLPSVIENNTQTGRSLRLHATLQLMYSI